MKRPGFLKRGERVRLQTFLARSGIASRRAAEEMITHGRIAVNGETVTAMGLQVVPGVDRVEVDGEEVKVAPTTWLALHKPAGYVTTRTDPFGRRTVYELLPDKYHGLFHVGRLDRDSEGLLLLTNDGELANRFLHPSFGITKEYDVIVTGKPTDAALRQLVEGVELEDGVAHAESAKLVGPAGNGQSRVKLVLREGKKREVRRMMSALGHEVVRLVRRRFGPIDLAELPKGKWRIVAPEELAHVRTPRRDEKPHARDTHNAYGSAPGKPRAKSAAAAKQEASAKSAGGATFRAAAKSARAAAGAKKGDPPRPHGEDHDDERRPHGKYARGDRKPARGARKPAPRAPRFDEGEAPPRKRPIAPAARRPAEPDDWADRPRVRTARDDAPPQRPGARGSREDRDEPRRPAPRGRPGDRDERRPARGGSDREERAAGPRSRGADDADRPRGSRDDRDAKPRPGARGKVGDRDPRRPARGGSDREERGAGPRGRGAEDGDRPAGSRDDRDAKPRPPARGKAGGRDDRPARGAFGRDERPAAPRRKGGEPEDWSSGTGRRGFDRAAGGRGVQPPAPRPSAPVDEEPDELDAWGTLARRPARGGGRGPAGARGGPPARGGRPGGRPGGKGKPGGGRGPGGKPGGKPRKPGGGPRGR